MKRVSKFFRQYLPFSSAGVKGVLAYKAQTFMWLFIAFIDVFFIVFLNLVKNQNNMEGLLAQLSNRPFMHEFSVLSFQGNEKMTNINL